MKRSFMILLASMLLVFSLTACGRNDNNAQTSDDPPTTNQETNANGQNNGTQNDAIMGGSSQNGATNGQNGESGSQSSTANGQENSTMNETAPNGTTDQGAGVSYEQMLRNGRIHDTDGLLNDGENAVSDIAGGVKNAAGDIARGAKNAVNNMTR